MHQGGVVQHLAGGAERQGLGGFGPERFGDQQRKECTQTLAARFHVVDEHRAERGIRRRRRLDHLLDERVHLGPEAFLELGKMLEQRALALAIDRRDGARLLAARLTLGEGLFGGAQAHIAAVGDGRGHLVDGCANRAGFRGHVARMQPHVAVLNTLGRQRSQRAQILGQPDGSHHTGELGRGFDACDLAGDLHRGMHAGHAAHRTHCHRQLQLAVQRPVGDAPFGQRRVAAVPRGKRVRPRLDRAPVLAESEQHRVDAVHDAFVVGGGAVRIALGKHRRLHDAAGELLRIAFAATDQRRKRHLAAHDHGAAVGEVRQDAQTHAAAGQLLDARGDALAHRVDGVGSHRVAHVHDQMRHQHGATGIVRAERRQMMNL